MWTLVIFTLLGNPGAGGGMSSTMTTVEFSSKDLCSQAEKGIEKHGPFGNTGSSVFQISGKCVQTK